MLGASAVTGLRHTGNTGHTGGMCMPQTQEAYRGSTSWQGGQHSATSGASGGASVLNLKHRKCYEAAGRVAIACWYKSGTIVGHLHTSSRSMLNRRCAQFFLPAFSVPGVQGFNGKVYSQMLAL